MRRSILFLALPLALSACAYMMDEPIQDVRIETPGAKGAKCYVYVKGMKYKINPPETINVTKARENLRIDCLAPGNRRQEVFIKPSIDSATHLNIGTGVGFAWDYLSGAMYKYPDIIEVSFIDAPVVPEPLPAHNNPDVRPPETYVLEEFIPSEPRMNEDRFKTRYGIEKRQRNTRSSYEAYTDAPALEGSTMVVPGKGDLQDVGIFDSLSETAIDPAGSETPASE